LKIHRSETALEYRLLKEEVDAALGRVLASGVYTQGREVAALEEEFAAFGNVRHGVLAASGTMALVIGLKALGIGPGDEVIIAPYSCVTTTFAIAHTGARIRFADIEKRTLTLDPARVEEAITERTRALMAVHIDGQVAEMGDLRAIARRRGLLVLEDAASAAGAYYRGQPAGSLGDAGVVSFGSSKILGGMGPGGIVLTDSDEVAGRARQLAAFGRTEELADSAFDLEGYNAQMGELLAAAIRAKLPYLAGWAAKRRAVAVQYDLACDRLGVGRLHPAPWTEPAYRYYVIRVPRRDQTLRRLIQAGVEASAHFVPPLHLRPLYSELGYRRGDFPVAEQVCEELICLPCHPHLPDEDVQRVIGALVNNMG
jgi:dTDP-4-amino-4,6-dideoxygalactose transaminase